MKKPQDQTAPYQNRLPPPKAPLEGPAILLSSILIHGKVSIYPNHLRTNINASGAERTISFSARCHKPKANITIQTRMKLFTKTLLTAGIALAPLPSYAQKEGGTEQKGSAVRDIHSIWVQHRDRSRGCHTLQPRTLASGCYRNNISISVPWSSDIDQTTAFAPYYKLKTEEIQIFREQ